jgi:predicted DNA-binding protein
MDKTTKTRSVRLSIDEWKRVEILAKKYQITVNKLVKTILLAYINRDSK